MTNAATASPQDFIAGIEFPAVDTASKLREVEAVPFAERVIPRTTWSILERAAQQHPNELANIWVPDPAQPEQRITYTFSELLQAATRYANLFTELGVGRNDAVALLTPNLSRFLPAMLGAQAVGIVAPINPTFDGERIATLLHTTGTKVIIAAGPEFGEDRWKALTSQVHRVGVTAVLALRPDNAVGEGPDLGTAPGVTLNYLDDAAAESSPHQLSVAPPQPESIASFFHTGGTTGAPKVAAHTHENEAFVAWNIVTAANLSGADRILAGLPLFHVNGVMVTGLSPILAGTPSVWPGPLGWRDPALLRNLWRLVEEFGITTMSAVPTVYTQLAMLPVDADISTLRTPVVGAASLPKSVGRKFAEHTGIQLQEGYGLTEAVCASSFTVHGNGKPGSVGQRLPYQQMVAAAIDETGAATHLPAGELGEILISGPAVFAGYVQRTPEGFTLDRSSVVDGWLRTGDLGYVDADERVWITGRSKDLIIRGGHNIDPSVIEEALLTHPNVTSAAAIGRPDQHSGEVPIAYVTVNEQYGGEDLVAWAAQHIDEPAARPQTVEVLADLPLTIIGKPFKPELRARAIASLLSARLAKEGFEGAAVESRLSDRGLVIGVSGSSASAFDVARSALEELAIEAEVRAG